MNALTPPRDGDLLSRHPIGFYAPDPGGHPPNILLSRTPETVTAYQPRNGLVLSFDADEWIDLATMKAKCMEVATGARYAPGGPMHEMRDSLLAGYISSLADAVELASRLEEHVRDWLLQATDEESPPAPR